VAIDGSGFTPGDHVDVAIDGTVVSTAEVYPDGTVSGSVSAPFQQTGERPFTVTLTEHEQPVVNVQAATRVTALSLRLKPRRAKPSARVRFIGSGFTLGSPVYGHYLFGGKLRRTVTLGVPSGPCGHIDVKRRQIPIAKPRTGRWTLQADTLKTYRAQPDSVFVRLAITVQRVLAAR
jgi:hypothetical protein